MYTYNFIFVCYDIQSQLLTLPSPNTNFGEEVGDIKRPYDPLLGEGRCSSGGNLIFYSVVSSGIDEITNTKYHVKFLKY